MKVKSNEFFFFVSREFEKKKTKAEKYQWKFSFAFF